LNLLQPRYRRLLTVGALLDESILLFREHWIAFALFSLVALAPQWALLIITSTSGAQRAFARPGAQLPPVEDWFALLGLTLLSGVLGLLWSAASTAAAATYLGGGRPSVSGIYGLALKRLVWLILTTLLFFVLLVLLLVASTVLFVVTLFGTLGTLIALIGLIIWWANPARRRPWLKWLIVLTAPFGLLTYYSVSWFLYLPAVVLEGAGPISALRRSGRLVEGQWFRAAGVLSLASLIVFALIVLPLAVVVMLMNLAGLGGSVVASNPSATIASNTATIVLQVLFSSIGAITYVLLFVDLRNRREGTDLVERISSLESSFMSFRGEAQQSRSP
jgi:hypothetical protein